MATIEKWNCPELSDRNWIIEQKRAGLKNPDIAKKLGVCVNTVRKACKYHNIMMPIVIVHNPDLKFHTPHNIQK